MNAAMTSRRAISLALISGAFWGLPFVIPLMLSPLSPGVVTLGRFLFFFFASLFGCRSTLLTARQLSIKHWLKIFTLSALGFWLYTYLLFSALPHTGGVAASLIIGLLPVTIPLYARDSLTRRTTFRWGLLLLFAGIAVLSYEKVFHLAASAHNGKYYVLLFIALISWSVYSVENSKFIKSTPQLSPEKISQLMGLISFPCVLLLLTQLISLRELSELTDISNGAKFVVGSAALGIGSSFFANRLWNKSSLHLPNSLMGPLMISETAAGLTYSFLFEHRLPSVFELAALILFALGVALCLRKSPQNSIVLGHERR